ncbi:MAG: hypothetical protein GXP63_05295 [DPANN group archaeon]|nr:hypothetical protein [DPANN group archaeon]
MRRHRKEHLLHLPRLPRLSRLLRLSRLPSLHGNRPLPVLFSLPLSFSLFAFFLSFLLLVSFASPSVVAVQKDIQLLAVSEGPDGLTGSMASLNVEVKPGSGRVFIDSFPLTKLDTQLSTRFAKETACNRASIDCSRYDFFYTIRSSSSIIGGPSAGAAITLLTVAALEDYDVDPKLSITGTINSGGLIGPVGGLKQKIQVAQQFGLSTVFIPEGERDIDEDNRSFDLVAYGRKIGIDVVEVATIDDALYRFFGIRQERPTQNITISPDYQKVMETLAHNLCNRAEGMRRSLSLPVSLPGRPGSVAGRNASLEDQGLDLLGKGLVALQDSRLYSSASFCFGAGLKFRNLIVQDMGPENVSLLLDEFGRRLRSAEGQVDARIPKTVTDLQTMMIVQERLIDARTSFERANESFATNKSYAADLSYAIERLASAASWSHFFGLDGKTFSLDQKTLQESCTEKMAEAQERLDYVRLFLPLPLEDTQQEIHHADQDRMNGDYALCLFKASKAKAEADVVMNALGFQEENLNRSLGRKLDLVRQVIVQQDQAGLFPILGYSYYEYARSLEHSDVSSALIYAEYALELSNLQMYFGQQKKKGLIPSSIPLSMVWVLLTGLSLGLLLGLVLFSPRKNKDAPVRKGGRKQKEQSRRGRRKRPTAKAG